MGPFVDEPLLYVTLATLRDLQVTLDRHDREGRDIEGRLKMVRARKLEEIGQVASFLVGVGAVGDPAAPVARPMIAVVTEEDFVFLASDYDEDAQVEYARVPRNDVVGVEVLDGDGQPVSEYALRPPDPTVDPVGTFIVAIDRAGPEDDDHRLGFAVRSAIVAGEIRDRLRRFAAPQV